MCVAIFSVESKQKGGTLIAKYFNTSKYSYFEEPFSSLTKQIRSLCYSIQDEPLKHIRTS